MTERVPVTVYLTPAEYRVMAQRAQSAREGMQVHHFIEASITRMCRPTAEDTLRARIAAIVSLHSKGFNDREIAERLGLKWSTVYYHRHDRLKLPKNDPRGGNNHHTTNPKEGN